MNKNIFCRLQASVSEWVQACSINGILRLQQKCTKASDFIHCPRTPAVLSWRWQRESCREPGTPSGITKSNQIAPDYSPASSGFSLPSGPAIYHIPDIRFPTEIEAANSQHCRANISISTCLGHVPPRGITRGKGTEGTKAFRSTMVHMADTEYGVRSTGKGMQGAALPLVLRFLVPVPWPELHIC